MLSDTLYNCSTGSGVTALACGWSAPKRPRCPCQARMYSDGQAWARKPSPPAPPLILCQLTRGKTILKPKKPVGEVFPAWGVSNTQKAAGTLTQGAEQDISGTLLSLSIFSVPLGAYFKNSALITQTLLKPTESGMPHQLHSGGTSLLSSSRDFSERYSF